MLSFTVTLIDWMEVSCVGLSDLDVKMRFSVYDSVY